MTLLIVKILTIKYIIYFAIRVKFLNILPKEYHNHNIQVVKILDTLCSISLNCSVI